MIDEDAPVKAEETHGQAWQWFGQVVGLAVVQADMKVSEVPGGAAKMRDVDAAVVMAIHACGRLIGAALSTNPNGNDLDPDWGEFKAAITRISCAMDEAFSKK